MFKPYFFFFFFFTLFFLSNSTKTPANLCPGQNWDHLDINLSVGRISPISAADGSRWLGNRASKENVTIYFYFER